MSKERDDDSKTLEERVQKLEQTLDLLIRNLARNNRAYLTALKDIARATREEECLGAVAVAEGNICPVPPPGCDPEEEV